MSVSNNSSSKLLLGGGCGCWGCDIITSGNIMTLNYFENSVKPWTGFEPVTSTSMGLTSYIDRNLTKVTLYQAELPRQLDEQSNQQTI
jgi:hypothetical protein